MILLCISSADVRIALLHRRKLVRSQVRFTGRLKQDVRKWRGHWFLVEKKVEKYFMRVIKLLNQLNIPFVKKVLIDIGNKHYILYLLSTELKARKKSMFSSAHTSILVGRKDDHVCIRRSIRIAELYATGGSYKYRFKTSRSKP